MPVSGELSPLHISHWSIRFSSQHSSTLSVTEVPLHICAQSLIAPP